MAPKSHSPIRQSASMSEKMRAEGLPRVVLSRLADQQRAERERRDRYGRFGGR